MYAPFLTPNVGSRLLGCKRCIVGFKNNVVVCLENGRLCLVKETWISLINSGMR